MIERFLFNRRLLIMVVGLLIVSGLAAIETLPRLEDPRIVARNARVLTVYPGADPQQVEALVSRILEDEIRTLPEVKVVSSTSREGISSIAIELQDSVTRVEPVWSRVRDRISEARSDLPDEVSRPRLIDDRFYAFSMVIALTRTDEGSSHNVLARYADRLEERYRAMPGTDYTNQFGRAEEVIQLDVEPAELAQMGLSAADLARRVQGADARRPAGVLDNGGSRRAVEIAGAFGDLERVRDVTIRIGNGQRVRVGDIAEVRRSVADPPDQRALLNGEETILLGVRMAGGGRIDAWSEQARQVLEEFEATMPRDLDARVVFDQSGYTQQRLESVVGNLLLGLVIVVSLLFLTLGWRGALAVGVAIPATMLLVMSLFRIVGVNVHQISITGIIVAIGLIVDNAIVITNALRERLGMGESHVEAVRHTLRHFAAPLLASTLTTILAFMPIVLMPGSAGEFVGPLAIAVILALISSYLVAMLMIPAISPLMLTRPTPSRTPGPGRVIRRLQSLVSLALRRPVTAILLTVLLPILGAGLLPTMPISFFPAADRDQFQVQVRLPPGASVERTHEVARTMTRVIRADDDVENVWFVAGNNAPMVYYNLIPRDDNNPAFAQAIVDTRSASVTTSVIERLQDRLDREFPGAQTIVRRYEQGPPVAAPLELRLYGPDLPVLADLGNRIAALMHGLPEVTHVQTLVARDRPKLRLEPDQEEIAALGLSGEQVAGQLDALVSGRQGGFMLEETEQMPVQIRYPESWRQDPGTLAGALIQGDTGVGGVPVGAIASQALIPSWRSIRRRQGERVQVIRGYLEVGELAPDVMRNLDATLEEELSLPPGYRLETGGEAEERNEAVTRLLSFVAILILLMFATVALTFNSFRRAFIVFFSGAQAFGLGLLALAITGQAFGFIIIVGIMGLVGVAINATIIMLAALDEDDQARSGSIGAMVDVITGPTFRHIGSTTLTTFGGLIPLMIAGGTLWPPFAQTFGFGLLLATVIALVVTPAAYRLLCAEGKKGEVQ
ncbi:multidrug efflux pump subunit AcrB [Halospina denitrificans]|uniref:Multidrug efflux pump subunit AcrB n=1 Tax=Halospina denitrificans TaxID=332522 RepID=A0A4R7K0A1_9GAMM|nr:efflux RND transporter permease subunit [Halospina denitrificans]TDT44250.1 multidrug efflux pump subunit AcrB [Halospina denitrificans]